MPTLHHYTTAQGFLGILEQQCLWATNFSFLNDSTEILYGYGVAEQALRGYHGGPVLALDKYLTQLRLAQNTSEIYVSCFSHAWDDLNQWRAYGGLRSDRYCISFDPELLSDLYVSPDDAVTAAQLAEIIYDRDHQIGGIRQLFERRRVPDDPDIIEAIRSAISRFKNPAFSSEREWRLVVTLKRSASQLANFYVSAEVLRPYVELRRPAGRPLPITRILLLPASHPKRALKAAKMALERFGYGHVEASVSDVPFIS